MLKAGQKFKVLVLAALAAVGSSAAFGNSALAGDKAAALSGFNKVEPHELRDIEVGVENLQFVAGLAAMKHDEVQDLVHSMHDAFDRYASAPTSVGPMSDELLAHQQNVALAFKTFDAAQTHLRELEVEMGKYEYAIEILEFFAG